MIFVSDVHYQLDYLNSLSGYDTLTNQDYLQDLNLAKQIISDGEGAKKFITVKVINAKSILSAKKIALSVACSPLVKTAIAGEDANWGRIIMAIGKSDEKIIPNKIKIYLPKLGVFIQQYQSFFHH